MNTLQYIWGTLRLPGGEKILKKMADTPYQDFEEKINQASSYQPLIKPRFQARANRYNKARPKVTRELVRRALEENEGVMTQAALAKKLNISARLLSYYKKSQGIPMRSRMAGAPPKLAIKDVRNHVKANPRMPVLEMARYFNVSVPTMYSYIKKINAKRELKYNV
jgi:DNA invertase Pin-like site-specific DNA recombinase